MHHETRTPAPFSGLERDVNDLFRGFFGGAAPSGPQGLDILETEAAYEVHVDLPGVDMPAIELSFSDKTLKIAVRPETVKAAEGAEPTWHRRTRRPVEMEESIRFPKPIDAEAIDAALDRGVLVVTLPKTEAVRPRTIAIRG